jgi:hypothetical protein
MIFFIRQLINKHSYWLMAGLSLCLMLLSSAVQAQTKNYATGNITGERENVGNVLGLGYSPGISGVSAPLTPHTSGTFNIYRFYYGNGILNSETTSPATITASRTVGVSLLGIDLLTLAGGDAYVQFRYPGTNPIPAKTTSFVKIGTKPTGSGLAVPVGGLLSLGDNKPLVGEIYKDAAPYSLSGSGEENPGTLLSGSFATKLLVDPAGVWYAAVTPSSEEAYNSVRLKVRIPSDLLGVNVVNIASATVFNAFTYSTTGSLCSRLPAFTDEGNIGGLTTVNAAALKLVTLNQIVNNPVGAIDTNPATYSSFSSGVANAGVASSVSQNIYFDHTAAQSDKVLIKVGLSTGLLDLNLLGGGITFKAYKGTTPVGTDQSFTETILGLNLANIVAINGIKTVNSTFSPGAEFDRIEVVFNSGLLGLDVLSDAVRLFDVQLSTTPPTLTASIPLEAGNGVTVYAGQTLPTIQAVSPNNNILWYKGDSETPLAPAAASPVTLPETVIETAGSYVYYAAAQRPGCTNITPKMPVNITVLPLSLSTLPNGALSSVYAFNTPVATSAGRTLKYEVVSGALPTGITLNETTGILTGTPTQSGSFNFSVKITDITAPANPLDAGTHAFSLAVVTNLAITGGPFPTGIKGTPYSNALPTGLGATGGVGPYSYAIVPPTSGGARVSAILALPGTMSLSSTGTLSGTPDAVGSNTFTISATDAENNVVQADFTWIVESPLPVTLTSFSVNKEGHTALLTWATTAETNSDRFEIQRSQQGKQWGVLGTKQSNGESTSLKNYNFTDIEPLDGENLYRLKMIDRDGTFTYSRIESLMFEGLTASFYPNPVAEKLLISTNEFSKVTIVQIFDANGRTVYKSSATPSAEINVQNLASGLYVVQLVRKNGTVVTQKIIKQ